MKVSVVIICMNNLGNLYPCLDSIIKHTHVSYEIFVVAFMIFREPYIYQNLYSVIAPKK